MRDCIMRSSISNVVRVIKSRRMRWSGHVAHMGEKRNAYLKGRKRSLGDQAMNGRIILEWISEIGWQGVDWLYLSQDRDQ
jgi:hypothetical protein